MLGRDDRAKGDRQDKANCQNYWLHWILPFYSKIKTLAYVFTPPLSRLTLHRITLSARANTFGGIVRPICFAVLRLMMNSNFFGCSTGRLAGLVPFRILSTYVAARRYMSVQLTP